MAGEVTRRQQRQIAAEAPPPFLGAGTRDPGREIAVVESDISKVRRSNLTEKIMDSSSKKAPIWTKARRQFESQSEDVTKLQVWALFQVSKFLLYSNTKNRGSIQLAPIKSSR